MDRAKIIRLEGSALKELVDSLTNPSRKPYLLRVYESNGQVKFKVNESCWSPPLGHSEKQHDLALQEALR